jgi:hypothetical protein
MIKITSIEPRGFYRLLLRFSDGSEGERDEHQRRWMRTLV